MILSLLLVTLLALPADSAPQTRVLWLDAEHHRPYFIPETILFGGVKGAEVDAALVEEVRRRVEAKAAERGECAKCGMPVIGDVFGGPQRLPLTDELRTRRPLAFVATVESVTPGIDVLYGYVTSLVTLRVSEAITGEESLAPGTLLTYYQQSGSMYVGKVELCTEPLTKYAPRVGDRVLLVGARDRVNAAHVAGRLYQVLNDWVIVPPPLLPREDPAVPVSTLRMLRRKSP